MTVVDCSGCTALGSATVIVDVCPGIHENNNAVNIQLSPNPFSTSAEITSSKYFNDAELKVYDMLGNLVKQIKNISGNTIYIERSGMRNGMYFYKISEKNILSASGKFIVNRE
ncbi:MAG: T9SS type A sorting domain-containing protein [Bacteroidota bacterium]